MTKMTDAQEAVRGDIEDAMSQLGKIHESLRLIELRTRFLRERTGERVNTAAIGEELAVVRNSISIVHAIFEQRWIAGQASHWPTEQA